MIIKETTERSDHKNWVKKKLIKDGFCIIDLEGYTIKNDEATGLFDRRMFTEEDFDALSPNAVLEIIENEEPHLEAKIKFACKLGTYYRYVFYRYKTEKIYVYRFEGKEKLPIFKAKYDDFCDFINATKRIRDLKMISPLEEKYMPNIDTILRKRCGYAWMGNLDGILLSQDNQTPKALIEFQTTKILSVEKHCNNTWFSPKNGRKGDEQRWKVFDILSKQSKLPLIIIVWSPNKDDVNIKYKVVSDIIYSNDSKGRKPGLVYSVKDIIDYDELAERLNQLIND